MTQFARFPRYRLLQGTTPIQPLERLSAQLNGPRIYVKRDDLNELGGGGNKLRKLEFLIGAAKAKGASIVITLGARQSNHARLTAAAAARAGLKCELVLIRRVPRHDQDYLYNGNILLDQIFGATTHDLASDDDPLAFAEQRARILQNKGEIPYIIPMGGSNAVGILGYIECAFEIINQAREHKVTFNKIIVPNGSSGTQAGLVAGFKLKNHSPQNVVGFSVLDSVNIIKPKTMALAQLGGQLFQADFTLDENDIILDDSQLGPGYGVPTDAMIEAVELMARTEGLLIDPVYSGKAFAGLIAAIRCGYYQKNENILFLLTGGLPGIFAYRSIFT